MKQTLIKQLIKLEKMLSLYDYEFDIKLRDSHSQMLLIINLKEGDIPQILENWDCVRRIE